MSIQTIAQHTFHLPDLHWFAATSGDWNPIHIDPIAARRLMVGEIVVHGMFTLLWAMDAHFAAGGTCPANVNARFHRPILLEEHLVLTREIVEQDEVRLAITQGGEETTTILLGSGGGKNGGAPVNGLFPRAESVTRAFPELKALAGELSVAAESDEVRQVFSHAVAMLGPLPVASIMGLSRIVGMYCPGLHSLFAGVNLCFEPTMTQPLISWQVTRHTVPQAPVRVAISGGGLSGRLDAFVRPIPIVQPPIADAAKFVERDAFTGQVALIVGGSRGLGELTAKLVAAGGGLVIVTYLHGSADARRVADEIVDWGGHCQTLGINAEHPEEGIAALVSGGTLPTHIYYFASPRISRPKSTLFDATLFANLSRIYVDAFARLVMTLAKEMPPSIKIFYPSTVFLDELPREFAEYIAAKAAGEALCGHLERHIPGLMVLIRRLPRLPTDQTTGLVKRATADPLRELLGVVNEMHALAK